MWTYLFPSHASVQSSSGSAGPSCCPTAFASRVTLSLLSLLLLLQTDDPPPSNSDTVFFRDGIRRIDFVLAYVDDKDVEKRQVRLFPRHVLDICMLPLMCSRSDDASTFCVLFGASRQCLLCSFSGEEEGVWGQLVENRTGTGDRGQSCKKAKHGAQLPPSGHFADAHDS